MTRFSRPWLVLALLPILAGCEELDAKNDYACTGKGYLHRYRNGQELKAPAGDLIRFSLTTYRVATGYAFSSEPALPEQQNKDVRLDRARSNEVERLYSYDSTDSATRYRTLTTLVLNQVSGDFRLFHHRWVPPVEWKDSDQYFYAGNCMRTQA